MLVYLGHVNNGNSSKTASQWDTHGVKPEGDRPFCRRVEIIDQAL
jgi:hypothetical protein